LTPFLHDLCEEFFIGHQRQKVAKSDMVDPKTKIWDLCTDRAEQDKFENVRNYFGDLNLGDLNELDDPEDLIRDVLPAHRLLMRVFIRKYLIPLRERPLEFASTEITHIGS
jgi:hypothetical protein